jgi:hypothetical protein
MSSNELDANPALQTTSRSFVENGGNLITFRKKTQRQTRTVSQ